MLNSCTCLKHHCAMLVTLLRVLLLLLALSRTWCPQVSHHIHCNDEAFDEDVFSAFPFLRFDPRLPKAWYHQFQHIYMWATFPLLQIMFQVGAGCCNTQTRAM